MLILRNINFPVTCGSSTYGKVLEAWRQVIVGFEDLLRGMPLQVSNTNKVILQGLSSWHLCPNLIILVKKTVHTRFDDLLLPEQSIVTVGMQPTHPADQEGIQWSLTLPHLRYYGNPTSVASNENNTRINTHQLHLVAFGLIRVVWKIVSGDTMAPAFVLSSFGETE